jgi:hypothetical protein
MIIVAHTKTTVYTRKSQDRLNAGVSQTTYFFVRFDGPSFDGALNTVTPTTAKEILTWEKQSLTVSVYPLRYAVWLLEII